MSATEFEKEKSEDEEGQTSEKQSIEL